MAIDEIFSLLEVLQRTTTKEAGERGLLAQLPVLVQEANKQAETTETPTANSSSTLKNVAQNVASGLVTGVASASTRALGGGLTLLPVVSGLLKLFGVGRDKKQELPPLETFSMPAPIRAEAGLSRDGETYLVDRGAGDVIRRLPIAPVTPTPAVASSQPPFNSPGPTATTIQVNVQAMDSQSFLDRREDIARAVREAMLNSHSLNDVVSEL